MSKGDWRRPSSVSKKQYDEAYEAAFGVKEIKTWDPEGEDERVGGPKVEGSGPSDSGEPSPSDSEGSLQSGDA